MQLADTPDTDYCFIFLDTPLVRLRIDGLTISIFVKNNSTPLFKNDLSFLCSNFVTINEIINAILKVKSDFALEGWVSICYIPNKSHYLRNLINLQICEQVSLKM